MNKFNGLMSQIAAEYSVVKGKDEDPNIWKARLIYSTLGRMALASLFDVSEDESSSVVHMKNRVETLLQKYKEMYPELGGILPADPRKLSNEIYDIYLNTGCIYHKPNRIVMSAGTDAIENTVKFTRGYELEFKQRMSGLGTYMLLENAEQGNKLSDMFQLEESPLPLRWQKCIAKAKWQKFTAGSITKYLRMTPPFNRGYWVDKPDISGKISILYTGLAEYRLYYLYKVEHRNTIVSQLPQWQVEDYNYRSIANACLASEGVLPEVTYKYDGEIVYLKFGYLPPPPELYLWKLYTWPSPMVSLPGDFKRVCVCHVFESIKEIMMQQGYQFIEE